MSRDDRHCVTTCTRVVVRIDPKAGVYYITHDRLSSIRPTETEGKLIGISIVSYFSIIAILEQNTTITVLLCVSEERLTIKKR